MKRLLYQIQEPFYIGIILSSDSLTKTSGKYYNLAAVTVLS